MLFFFLSLLLHTSVLAQAGRWIEGLVMEVNGESVIGANIHVQGSNFTATSDIDGSFKIMVYQSENTLIISHRNYLEREMLIKNVEFINIYLQPNRKQESVVVTALGVKREDKALGYAVQSLYNEDITNVKSVNFTNLLAGKVAGLSVMGSSAGPTASANVTIRGTSSLLGNNQPLFVLNGMPINNSLYSLDDGLNGSSTLDFGNAAQIINPDDVASITVLKGAAACALYGSRAANGLIVVETKTGKTAQGWGISLNSSTSFNTPLKLPDFQNEFGFGGGGKYSYFDGSNYIGANEYYEAYGENWGPRTNGQLIKQFNSNGEARPFTPAPNNVRNFFRTGITSINNISLSTSNMNSDTRLSYTNLINSHIVPNSQLNRHSMAISTGKSLLKNTLRVRLNALYVNANANNIPNAGYDESSSIMYGWLWFPRQVEIADLKQYWQTGQEGVQQRYVENLWVNNPWLVVNENTNAFQNNRLISNINLHYAFNKHFSARLRYGADILNEKRQSRRAPSTKGVPLGSYSEDAITFSETNTEILLSYNATPNQDLPDGMAKKWHLETKVGANFMEQRSDIWRANNPELKFFGTNNSIYTLANARSGVLVNAHKEKLGINSAFALLNVAYKSTFYLDVSYRQDWSSTLVNPNIGINNADFSFGYPAVSGSFIASELFNLKDTSPISFLKFKGGYAEVGNGAPPYAFGTTFSPQAPFDNNSVFTTNSVATDPQLKNERTRAFEGGIDYAMFGDRFRLSASYYAMLSFNQIIQLPVAITSGYSSIITNGGEISNKGVEVTVHLVPVARAKFLWNTAINLAHNRSVLERLPSIIESGRYAIINDVFPGDEGGADLAYVAEVGELMGQLYGLGFVRDAETQQIIHENGLPLITDYKVSAGSYQPDLRFGWENKLDIGNFSFQFLFDGQLGGRVYSRSHALYNTGGTITNHNDPLLALSTTEGRTTYAVTYDEAGEPVYMLEQAGAVIGPGLMYNDNGELVPNTVAVEPGGAGYTGYFYNYYGNGFNRDNIEAATYDATYVKLREISLSYSIPNAKLQNTSISQLTFALIGRNVWLFSKVPTIDPETYSIRKGLFVNGFESTQLPSTRNIGISVRMRL